MSVIPDSFRELFETPEGVAQLTMTHPGWAFALWGWIRDKGGNERPVQSAETREDGTPVYAGVNILQWRLFDIFLYCRKMGLPCRIVGLKPRKTGLSTAAQWLLYWDHRTRLCESLTLGDDLDTSATIQAITQTFIKYDEFPWQDHGGAGANAKPNTEGQFVYHNGGIAHLETARDANCGRGKTPQNQHRSEVAHFFKSGRYDAAVVLRGTNESTTDQPGTLIIDESTPNGCSGYFYERYQAAITIEQHMRGDIPKDWNGCFRLTAYWYEFADYTDRDATREELLQIDATLTRHEEMLCDVKKLTLRQISWRRKKIASMATTGGEDAFLQEYVEDERSCFLSSGRPVFSREAIAAHTAASQAAIWNRGGLTEQANGYQSWTPSQTGRFLIREMPQRGRRYIAVADPATGAEQVKNTAKTDRHSCRIIRGGYFRETPFGQQWEPAAEVARIMPPFQDESRLAIRLFWQLIRFYGGPLTVVEFNNQGANWCTQLGELGCTLYQREAFDELTKTMKKFVGWRTDDQTRPLLVSALCGMLEPDPGTKTPPFLVHDKHTVAEMTVFAYNEKGRAEALSGQHDDDVLALAIGLFNIDCATAYDGQVQRRSRHEAD